MYNQKSCSSRSHRLRRQHLHSRRRPGLSLYGCRVIFHSAVVQAPSYVVDDPIQALEEVFAGDGAAGLDLPVVGVDGGEVDGLAWVRFNSSKRKFRRNLDSKSGEEEGGRTYFGYFRG